MAKLTALTPINHDGKDFAEGDVLEVADAAQAAQLVDSGFAVAAKASKARGEKTAAPAPAEAAPATPDVVPDVVPEAAPAEVEAPAEPALI